MVMNEEKQMLRVIDVIMSQTHDKLKNIKLDKHYYSSTFINDIDSIFHEDSKDMWNENGLNEKGLEFLNQMKDYIKKGRYTKTGHIPNYDNVLKYYKDKENEK